MIWYSSDQDDTDSLTMSRKMTYLDLGCDIEALWYALLWFNNYNHGPPMMSIAVHRYVSGQPGNAFLAELGSITWNVLGGAGGTNAV